ncbi:hypothetical protein DLREEDagrD3_06790 [Denitratisoma sp. agr-D3]
MAAHLSFDQAPPFSVPLRFFLTAPLFGIAAGLLLAAQGGEVLASRWHPATLALTHLLAAGFLLQVMVGALFQFVPVVTGGNVPRPRLLGGLVHVLISLGAPLLVLAFLTWRPALFTAAALVLGGGLALLCAVMGHALWQASARGATLASLRGALLALLLTAALGATLTQGLAGRLAGNIPALLTAHLAWGLGGWALLLLAGVSWSVVPMFQLTPPYPPRLSRGFGPWLLVALALLSLGLGLNQPLLTGLGGALCLLAGAAFAGVTLERQAKRKRKTTDTTLDFFRVAMACLLAAACLGLTAIVWPVVATMEGMPVLFGILLLQGALASAVYGMLYKIVPFLVWLHLQNRPKGSALPPNVNRMIAPKHSRHQLHSHLLGLALLLPLPWLPALGLPAGLCLAYTNGRLGLNLLEALGTYRRFRLQTPAGDGHPES